MVCSLFRTKIGSTSIQEAQKRFKYYYDKSAMSIQYSVGDWVLVKFPHEETTRLGKLSRPWHGPYRVVAVNDPDITVVKVYFPQAKSIVIGSDLVQ